MNRTRFTLREEEAHRLRPPEMAVLAMYWWARQDSNLQPDRYERPALTIELQALPRCRLRRLRNGADTPYNVAGDPAMPVGGARDLVGSGKQRSDPSLPGLTRQSICF
jgi:hypothetical protein